MVHQLAPQSNWTGSATLPPDANQNFDGVKKKFHSWSYELSGVARIFPRGGEIFFEKIVHLGFSTKIALWSQNPDLDSMNPNSWWGLGSYARGGQAPPPGYAPVRALKLSRSTPEPSRFRSAEVVNRYFFHPRTTVRPGEFGATFNQGG